MLSRRKVMGSEGLHLSLTQTPNLTPKRVVVTELLLAKWLVPSCGAVSEGDYTGQHPQPVNFSLRATRAFHYRTAKRWLTYSLTTVKRREEHDPTNQELVL